MRVTGIVLLLVIMVLGSEAIRIEVMQEKIKTASKQLASVFSKASKPAPGPIPSLSNMKPSQAEPDARCILCGIVVNEVQGFVAENISETVIEDAIRKDVCAHLPKEQSGTCDELVTKLPDLINDINQGHSVSVVCVDHGYCTAPFINGPDPQTVPIYTIDLDLPAVARWTTVCKNSTYQQSMGQLIAGLKMMLPDNGTAVMDLGRLLNTLYYPLDFAMELQGCALAMGVDVGWLAIINLGYEVTDGCTSIVAQQPNGRILHARNMDFWDGIWLTGHLKNLTLQAEFKKGGKTLFHATTFAGYVGVLSGMRPSAFSISINTRYYPQGISQLFEEVLFAITNKNASLVSFLARNVLTRETNFTAALKNLINDEIVADVYYTVAGTGPGQGAVISRNRTGADDVWMLQAPSRWFEVETNYDHWKKPPWFDDRVVPADNAMAAITQQNVTLNTIFKNVLSIKPVLNIQTTFTMLACPADGTYTSYVRNCAYPCTE